MNDVTNSVRLEVAERADKADNEYRQLLREKILFGLSVYPFLNASMLNVFLGTSTPKSVWKDVVLAELIAEGLVCRDEVTLISPHDRTQTYQILRLTANPYTPPKNNTVDGAAQAA